MKAYVALILAAGLLLGGVGCTEFYDSASTRVDVSFDNPLPVAGGYTTFDFDIANLGTTSADVDTIGWTITSFYVPATVEGATMQWECALTDGGTPSAVMKVDGTNCENTITAAAVNYVTPDAGPCYNGVTACRFLAVKLAAQTGAITVTGVSK